MIKFCAIDPSISCTAISILTMEGDEYRLIEKTSLVLPGRYTDPWKKKVDMLALFSHWLDGRIDDISFFVFENYSYGSPGKLADLGELGGLLKNYITTKGKYFDVIPPKSVKLKISGNGNASKEKVRDEVMKFLINRDEVVFNNLDESDSVAVGIAYAMTMNEAIDINEHRED